MLFDICLLVFFAWQELETGGKEQQGKKTNLRADGAILFTGSLGLLHGEPRGLSPFFCFPVTC
jgi:hypothetical protein